MHEGGNAASEQQLVPGAIHGGLCEIEVSYGGFGLLLILDGGLALCDGALEAILLGANLRAVRFYAEQGLIGGFQGRSGPSGCTDVEAVRPRDWVLEALMLIWLPLSVPRSTVVS